MKEKISLQSVVVINQRSNYSYPILFVRGIFITKV